MSHNQFNLQRKGFYPHDFPGWQQDYFEPPPFGPPPAGAFPIGPPPGFSPPIPAGQMGPIGIRYCQNRNTYIWLWNGRSFWFYPISVERHAIRGFRWSRRRGWVQDSVNLNDIRYYQCFLSK